MLRRLFRLCEIEAGCGEDLQAAVSRAQSWTLRVAEVEILPWHLSRISGSKAEPCQERSCTEDEFFNLAFLAADHGMNGFDASDHSTLRIPHAPAHELLQSDVASHSPSEPGSLLTNLRSIRSQSNAGVFRASTFN